MNLQTAQMLENIKGPSIMDLLELNGVQKANNYYSMNAHSFDAIDYEELNKFIETIAKDYSINIKTKSPLSNAMTPIDFIKYDYSRYENGEKHLLPAIILQNKVADSIEKSFTFFHVQEYMITNKNKDKVEARLYLNLKPRNIVAFSNLFYEESKKRGLPTYFKFSNMNKDSDKLRNDVG